MKYIGENAVKKLISLIKGDLAKKQDSITVSGLLKSDGSTISAAVPGTDYAVDVPEPSQSRPQAPATSTTYGVVGTSTKYAREDHQHPKQIINEVDLKWGGGSINGNVTPIDSAMMPMIGYNKTDCARPEGITVEYSNDAGATWNDYGVSDVTKSNLVSMCGNSSVFIGGGPSITQKTLDDQLRITVNAPKCLTYTQLNKILIEISTNGATKTKVLVEKANGTAPEDFTEIGTYDITGWSGWNSIDIGRIYFGGSNKNNMWVLRFTFSIGGLNTSGYTSAMQLLHILFLGTTNWNTPSVMAKTGHLYSYDVNQNAVFPASVKANSFAGNATETVVDFTERTDRANIVSGERLTTMTSKIAKWFADLKALAFKDKVDKTDLSDDVQASLNKADSALQSYSETDPTVPAWAKAETKPTYTAAEVGADASGSSEQALNAAKTYTDTKIAAIPTPDVSGQIGEHNTSTSAHNDIRELITGLTSRLNALADSDDTTLDQLSEIVAYIKSNRSLIEEVTTNKVNVADIIDNLTTNVTNKPLSAAQGVALKALIDAIPDWAKADTKPTYTKSEVGLSNVDNVQQYSADNPPPYPVTSVNGKTGDVTVSAPEIPTTTNLIKGDGAGGLAEAETQEATLVDVPSGLLKGNGTAISTAVAGTDYAFPVIMRKVTLTTAGWNSSVKQQTVTVSGILADGTKQRVICSPVDESYNSLWNSCYVQCVGHGADSLTFQCTELPTAAVEVFVSIQLTNLVL